VPQTPPKEPRLRHASALTSPNLGPLGYASAAMRSIQALHLTEAHFPGIENRLIPRG
jgi:hypothetical protein